MTRTGDQILQSLSELLDDWFASTTTGSGNSAGTTLVDSTLARWGDNRLLGRWVRLAATPFAAKRASANTQSSGTLTVSEAFSAQVASSIGYQLHRYEPALKFKAIDEARLEVMDYLYQIKKDDTTTSDGVSTVYDRPSSIEQGPHVAFFENPQACDVQWNFLSTPMLDALDDWTAASMTASLYTVSQADLLIPKYQDRSCTKLVIAGSTNGTYSQVVASMRNGITATLAAGRKVTLAMWVYSNVASRVSLKLLTDAGTLATGTAHQGRGWELIFVEGTVAGNNTTTLTARLDVTSASAPLTIYAQRAWLYYGDKERVCDNIYDERKPYRATIDDTTKHVIFDEVPPRGYQIRLQGKAPLTALGTTVTTQGAATMEVDEKSEKILATKAAEIMLRRGQVRSDDVPAVEARIAAVTASEKELKGNWKHTTTKPFLKNPFA